jgi:hypothetical protein
MDPAAYSLTMMRSQGGKVTALDFEIVLPLSTSIPSEYP